MRLALNSDNEAATSADLFLELDVGGIKYMLSRNLLLQFPESLPGKMLGSEESGAIMKIERSGELFKYVYDFMFYGKLPRNEFGVSLPGDAILKEVMLEAEFYHLPALVGECKELLQTSHVEHIMKHYAIVLNGIESATYAIDRVDNIVYRTAKPGSLLSLLRSRPYAPAWVKGRLGEECDTEIFKSTTVQNVNVAELVAAAVPSPFGKGEKTVLDKTVRDSLEIPASQLGDLRKIVDHMDISSLAPNKKLTLKPYKLVIYKKEGHFEDHRDTVRDPRHIGTLVLILNSKYKGGELEVRHGQEKVVVTDPFQWVAMYGDCVHTIRPVTSGTRVSLIFDIWNESEELSTDDGANDDYDNEEEDDGVDDSVKVNDEDYDAEKEEEEEEEEDYYDARNYDEYFWPTNEVITEYWSEWSPPSVMRAAPLPTVDPDHVWNRIYAAMDRQLETHTTVSICLDHLYPACQANPSFLKGDDAMLYQILKNKYSVGVTVVTIARSVSENDGASIGYCEFSSTKLLTKSNILFIPNAPEPSSVLHYSPGSEYTGNQPEDERMVYLVAALVVRQKKS